MLKSTFSFIHKDIPKISQNLATVSPLAQKAKA